MQTIKNRLKLAAFTLVLTACGGGGGGGSSGVDARSEQQIYDDALAHYSTADYAGAASELQTLLSDYPSGALTADALLYFGKAYYWLADYTSGKLVLGALISDHPSSNRLDNGYYWRGKCQQALGNFEEARSDYQAVINLGGSSYEDNAVYAIASTWFDEAELTDPPDVALYDSAIAGFIQARDYPANSKSDNAQYDLGRSYHAKAKIIGSQPDFDLARAAYALVTSYPTSVYLDNAALQAAKTYLDQADLAPTSVAYTLAFTELSNVINTTDGSDDIAQFYIGKSYHAIANLSGNANDFSAARTEYGKVNSSNYPASVFLDNAALQAAKTYLDQADLAATSAAYTTAVTELSNVITNTDGSDDIAQFYIGKSYHAIANLSGFDADFDSARTEYGKVNTTSYPASSFIDNAAFQSAKTYFEQAEIATIPAANLYIGTNMAADQFRAVIANTEGSDDLAQYYVGKSYHAAANISALPQDYATARSEYAMVDAATYPASAFIDNAAYRAAKTYYDEKNYVTAISSLGAFINSFGASSLLDLAHFYKGQSHYYNTPPDYLAARSEYALVISDTSSLKRDNAQYFTGLTYHKESKCVEELNAMQAVINMTGASTVLKDSAQVHVNGITPPTDAQHPLC